MNFDSPIIIDMIEKCKEYPHQIRTKHISVVIKNDIPISDYKYNHLRPNLLGLSNETAHAEISALYALFRHCCSRLNLTPNHSNIIGYLLQKWKNNQDINVRINNRQDIYNKLRRIMSVYSIIVLRIDNTGNLINSKPCIECLNVLKLLNLKYVHYSTDLGTIHTERVKHSKTEHICGYHRSLMR
jgi:hypothetical protein